MAIQRIQAFFSATVALYWPATIFLGVIAVVLHEKTGDMALVSIVLLLVLIGVIGSAVVFLYRLAVVAVALLLFLAVLGFIAR